MEWSLSNWLGSICVLCLLAKHALFTLEFGFQEIESSPSRAEFIDLMCQIDLYFQTQLWIALGDASVDFHGSLYDYSFQSGKTQPVSISFIVNSTYADGDPVDPQAIVDALNVGTADIMFFIYDYVWATPKDSVFQNTSSASFASSVATSPVLGVLEPPFLATCPEINDRDEELDETSKRRQVGWVCFGSPT